MPISNEATKIFTNEILISFKPKEPTFFLKLTNNNIVQTMADILVAKARPPMPINLERMIV